MVVVDALAVRAFGLAGQVFAQHRRVRRPCALCGSTSDRQFLVLDLDQLDGVGGDVAVVGDDHRHLLHLEVDLLVGQHRLHVAGQGRHPVQLQRLQVVGGEHRVHAGQRQGALLVDGLDAGVGVGAAHDVHEQHAGHLDVVDVVALALDEARVFLALAGAADALELVLALEFVLLVLPCIVVRLRPPRRWIASSRPRTAPP